MEESNFYKIGWAINGNYYYEDNPNFSLYAGGGVHQMRVRSLESGYNPFFALNGYYGGQFKITLKEDVFDLALGGELGWMMRLYTGNPFSSSLSIFLEQSLGISPKMGFNWRIDNSWATLGLQVKYNAYFSLNPNFYSSSFASGIHQWLQPGLCFKMYL